MRLPVDAAGETADDDDPGRRELAGEPARDAGAVTGAAARTDDGDADSGGKRQGGLAADEQSRRRIVDRAQERRKPLVGAGEPAQAAFREPPAVAPPRRSRAGSGGSAARAAARPDGRPARRRRRRAPARGPRWSRRSRRQLRRRPVGERLGDVLGQHLGGTPRARPRSPRRARPGHGPARRAAAARRRGRAAPTPDPSARARLRRAAPAPAATRSATAAEPSPGAPESSWARGLGTVTTRSNRSSSARESLSRYRASRCAEQLQSSAASPRAPHGHRFIVPTSWKRAGNSARPSTRAIETTPSSSGCRSASSAVRWNSGSSSRSSTPRCARLASPGRGFVPPPTIAAVEALWCGARKGGTRTSGRPVGRMPATEWIRETSSASWSRSAGRMPGRRRASIVLPVPGGPASSRL